MRKDLKLAFSAFAIAVAVTAAAQSDFRMLYVPHNTAGTVAQLQVHSDGTLTLIQTYTAGPNPYDCTITPDGKKLLVANASALITEPVVSFAIDGAGNLSQQGQATVGDGTLSIAMSRFGHALLTEATQDDVIALDTTGAAPTQTGSAAAGIFPVKVVVGRDGEMAFVSGTQGNAYLNTYRVNANGSLTPLQIPANNTGVGSGQGLAAHPLLDVVYQSTGLGNQVFAFDYAGNGAVSQIDVASNGGNSCTELAVHPSGRWLYVCNVVSDTLTVLPINPDGTLENANQSFLIGSDIRDVVCDNEFVYVTDESSSGGLGPGVQVYKVGPGGALIQVGTPVHTGGTRPSHMALWVPPKQKGTTFGFSVIEGSLFGGNSFSLQNDDNDKLFVLCDEGDPNMRLTATANHSVPEPFTLDVAYELSSSRNDLVVFFDQFDFSTNQWFTLGSALSPLVETRYQFSTPGPITRFLTSTTNIEGQVRAIPTQDLEAADGWLISVDLAEFVVGG